MYFTNLKNKLLIIKISVFTPLLKPPVYPQNLLKGLLKKKSIVRFVLYLKFKANVSPIALDVPINNDRLFVLRGRFVVTEPLQRTRTKGKEQKR